MSKPINHGDFYVKNRRNMEKNIRIDLDGSDSLRPIEGFEVVSRSFQLKNPNKFVIADGLGPGQTVMCKQTMARYIKISRNSKTPLSIQSIHVYDENGQNVSFTSNDNYINEYELTIGNCNYSTPVTSLPAGQKLQGSYRAQLPTAKCEELCNDDSSCTGFGVKNETSSKGLNQCWTYKQPNITGDGDKNYMCRTKQRKSGTSKASSSSLYNPSTHSYLPIELNNGTQVPSLGGFISGGTQTNSNREWNLDLGKEVNVKQITITINKFIKEAFPQTNMTLYLLDKYHNTLIDKPLQNVLKQTIDINIPTSTCGGPVAEKNISDFDELKELQTIYNRQLQEYNQALKDLIENSKGYMSASNRNNNKFANTYLKDAGGAVGYVTDRGVWKHLPNPSMGDSMQGKNGCPINWANAPIIKVDAGQSSSIANASEGEIIKMGGESLIKGTSTIMNQSCNSSGQNLYITNPGRTANRRFIECSQNPGSYQSDLGNTTLEACAKRAEDMGSNVFQMGQNVGGGLGACYINGGGNVRNAGDCPGQMGKVKQGHWGNTGGSHWWNWNFGWIPGYKTFATYQTSGADNRDLGKTYHITDDLTKKEYPNNMVTRNGDDFQLLSGYNSYGNDIISGSGLTVEQVKQKCIATPGAAGFYINGNNYWIKNANMWPNGKRQFTGGDLYVRNTAVNNDNSCSKEVNFSQQNEIDGYPNAGFMDMSTTCGLGTISARDTQFIRQQYNKLNAILEKIHEKIIELSATDISLNKRLLDEYKTLKNNLHKYEDTYKEIRTDKEMSHQFNAMYEDANLQMLSYNKSYILWSILALGVTAGAMKIMK
jgi:hypothetical protein